MENGKAAAPGWLGKLWNYRESLLHFLLGTLLNVYTIFYFKGGTFLSSAFFLGLLATLLILNEIRPPRISKHVLRNSLFSLCLISYLNILVSILAGSIGAVVFTAAIVLSIAIQSFLWWILQRKLDAKKVAWEIRRPSLAVTGIYVLFYLFKVLPPVPLSVKYIGVFHHISKIGSEYQLDSTRPKWRFWENGDQTFEAAPGDSIYCFVQIFSPTRFKDELFIRWKYHDAKRGWTDSDAIPLAVIGGRDEGYRGFTLKSNYQPGDWRVSVETAGGREVGRIGLHVIAIESAANREVRSELR